MDWIKDADYAIQAVVASHFHMKPETLVYPSGFFNRCLFDFMVQAYKQVTTHHSDFTLEFRYLCNGPVTVFPMQQRHAFFSNDRYPSGALLMYGNTYGVHGLSHLTTTRLKTRNTDWLESVFDSRLQPFIYLATAFDEYYIMPFVERVFDLSVNHIRNVLPIVDDLHDTVLEYMAWGCFHDFIWLMEHIVDAWV